MPVIKLNLPDGTTDAYFFDEEQEEGWSWFGWEWDDPSHTRVGTLTVTVCDNYGKKLFTDSVEITS